jgi:hypothetical protein
VSALKQVGCDPADKKKWGGACAATCIEVVPNVVRAIQGGLHSLCTPTAPVQPEQPGLCNEERHPNELVNSGGAAPPLHPPALAFAQSLSYHSVSEAVCLPMVCKTSDMHLNSCVLTDERAIQGGCNPFSAPLNA